MRAEACRARKTARRRKDPHLVACTRLQSSPYRVLWLLQEAIERLRVSEEARREQALQAAKDLRAAQDALQVCPT